MRCSPIIEERGGCAHWATLASGGGAAAGAGRHMWTARRMDGQSCFISAGGVVLEKELWRTRARELRTSVLSGDVLIRKTLKTGLTVARIVEGTLRGRALRSALGKSPWTIVEECGG